MRTFSECIFYNQQCVRVDPNFAEGVLEPRRRCAQGARRRARRDPVLPQGAIKLVRPRTYVYSPRDLLSLCLARTRCGLAGARAVTRSPRRCSRRLFKLKPRLRRVQQPRDLFTCSSGRRTRRSRRTRWRSCSTRRSSTRTATSATCSRRRASSTRRAALPRGDPHHARDFADRVEQPRAACSRTSGGGDRGRLFYREACPTVPALRRRACRTSATRARASRARATMFRCSATRRRCGWRPASARARRRQPRVGVLRPGRDGARDPHVPLRDPARAQLPGRVQQPRRALRVAKRARASTTCIECYRTTLRLKPVTRTRTTTSATR